MALKRWHGAGSCLGLRRGQLGRSERGSWSKPPAKKKKESPLTSRWIYVWANSQNTCLYLCHGYFCGFAHSACKCRRKHWCNLMLANTCVCMQAHTLKKQQPSTNYFPLGSPWEVIRNVSVCFIFSMCVFRIGGWSLVSLQGPPLLCRSVSLSPAESYVYFISPGCLFVLRCAAPPLAVSLLLVSCGSHHSYSPPTSLSPGWQPPSASPSAFHGQLVSLLKAHPSFPSQLWRGAEWSTSKQTWPVRKTLSVSLRLSQSLILSVCLFCSSVAFGIGTLHPALHPLSSFYSSNLSSVTAAKNGCTSDGLHHQLIAIFAPSVSFRCLDLIVITILLL